VVDVPSGALSRRNFPHIAEGHSAQAAAFCLPLIADTNIREGDRPDTAEIALYVSQFRRLSDERQVIRRPALTRANDTSP
jgi:hypothetical protein